MSTTQDHAPGSPAHEGRSAFGLGELAGVCAHYDLGEIRAVYEFQKGSSRSPKVLLETGRGRYLLKRRARGRDDPYRVAFSHDVQLFLQAAGFPTARLVGTARGNNSMVQLNDRVYEVFEFVEGEAFDRTPPPCESAGRLLARLHGLVREYQPRWPAPVWSFHDDGAVRRRLELLGERGIGPAAAGELRRLYDVAGASAARARRPHHGSAPGAQLLHGDWHPGNMIFRDGRVAAVLDFDGARSGLPLHDLAAGVLQFSLTRVRTNPDHWPDALDAGRFAAFLRGYGPGAGELAGLPGLMVEALVAEVATPIAATGRFAGREPGPFVRMVLRKGRWLLKRGPALVALARKSVSAGVGR